MGVDPVIRLFSYSDISLIVAAFAKHNWLKPAQIFETYWQEQQQKERFMWIAIVDNELAGYITLKWESKYPYFRDNHIPEIMDLNVLPPYRGKSIGLRLLKTAETTALAKVDTIGIGVGLYKDYGSAQRLYVRQGYIPDGFGVTYDYKSLTPGSTVLLDDDLILWFTKKLKASK